MSTTAKGTLPAAEVRAMFNRLAPRYDRMNRIMSAGLDQRWRRAAAAAADVAVGDRVLDCCTGTADLALDLADRVGPSGRVVALDFAEEMLSLAAPKVAGHPIDLLQGDALHLPFDDNRFDAATVGFGARNFANLDRGLAEMTRVVRPGGRVVVLDITVPRHLRALYGTWFDRVVPGLGRLVGSDAAAYQYLPASAKRFPTPPALAAHLAAAGLRSVAWTTFAGGMVALHYGRVV